MSLASPIPRLDRPVCQEDASLSGSDTTAASQSDNESSDSSDEDDGVFLGPRQPSELQLLAKLSSSVLSPLPAIHRVKKRDSREFLRRKTLLLSSETQPREINQDSDDSDCSSSPRVDPTSSPSKTSEGSDLTLRLSSFHLTTPRPNRPESPLDDVGSDKENVPIKPIDNPSPSRTGSTDHPVSIGQHLTNVEDSDDGELMKPLRTLTFAEFAQLDMGGLRLCDFSDPETGLEEREGGHEVIASASLQHVEQLGESLEGTVSPRATLSPSSTDDLDSPLPVARAGPVVIPVLSSHHFTSIRAETGSPCRPLPPTLLEPPIAESTDTLVQLTAIDSPVKDLPKTSATPSCATPMPPPELVQRGAKLLKFSSVKPPTLPQPTNSTARAFAIRGQLDSALTTRKISSMGPPQRSVSSSSSTSSTSTKHTEPKRTFKKPLAKSPVGPVVPLAQSTNRIIPRPALVAKSSMPRPKINALVKPAPPTSSIPLKRPIPQPQHVRPMSMVQPITSRLPSAAPPSRPTLGQPSRILRETQMVDMQMAPVFSIGVTGETQYMTRPSFHSPGRLGLLKRSIIDKGTPKKLGTPLRFGTPRQVQSFTPMMAASIPEPIHDVSSVPEPITAGPPSSATRQATENTASSPTPVRGSSEDHEEVSVALDKPPSSPKSPSPRGKSVRRPKRAIKPPPKPTVTPTIAPNMSEKELKTATQRNTMRNQVYHCAIDRQIIRQPGPRPPSPTSKIRTTAEKDEEEKKNAREDRARRRKGEEDNGHVERPAIEKLTQTRGPGDEEDFVTPARPTKRAKTDDKSVKWDREVLIVRDDGTVRPPSSNGFEPTSKSCIKTKIPLDKHGNVIESHRPVDNLKRTRIVVTAIFYDGEEPVPAPASATRSKKK